MSSSLRICGVLLRQHQQPNRLVLVRNIHQLIILKPLNIIPVKLGQQYQQERFYKNFGHKKDEIPKVSRYFHYLIGFGVFMSLLNWKA